MSLDVKLVYWPVLQGRGEFVRLCLEDAGVAYVDVARRPKEEGGGVSAVMNALKASEKGGTPLAPPILEIDGLVLSQTANICLYLAKQHGLVGEDDRSFFLANQLMLTLMDFVSEIHDTHHPISKALYYEDQKEAAKEHAALFLEHRLPKFLQYFETLLVGDGQGQPYVMGETCTYVDLAMFQVLSGLAYAFPKGFTHITPEIPRLLALREAVSQRPGIAAYLSSERRIEFNTHGIFRYYPELDWEG